MRRKSLTNPPVDSPEFKAGFAKASARLKISQAIAEYLRDILKPIRKEQAKILQTTAIILAAEKALEEMFEEHTEKMYRSDIAARFKLMKAAFAKIPSKNNSGMDNLRKLKKYLRKDRKSFSVIEANEIMSLCLDLGADSTKALYSEAIEKEATRLLAHMEHREKKDKSIREKHKQYLKFVKDGMSKRESARKVFRKWEERRSRFLQDADATNRAVLDGKKAQASIPSPPGNI